MGFGRTTDLPKKNKAVYTAISVACGWAGAVMNLCKPRNSEIRDQKLDDTDQPTDRRTDIVSYRVACERLKTRIICRHTFKQFTTTNGT